MEALAHTPLKPYGNIPLNLLEQESKLLQKIKAIHFVKEKQHDSSITDILKLEGELNRIWDIIENSNPDYVSLRRGKPLSFIQIQDMIKSQGRKVCLIEYFYSPDKLLIFILRADESELEFEEVDLPLSTFSYYLATYADEYLDILKDQGEAWQGLSKYLIAPIIKHLEGVDTLYFVPHRQLHYLPLHALKHNGAYLIENYNIVYSPSASSIGYCQNKRKPVSSNFNGLVLGAGKSNDADFLRNLIEEEADRIYNILGKGSSIYKGTQVTKKVIKEKSKGKDLIHFSCHGFFHPEMPMKSGLLLGNDEILSIEDIFQLELSATMVTLSACQTGLNKQNPGDDLIGLTRSFIYAGSPSVVVSLWSVSAQSTLEMMEKFYNHIKAGMSKIEALRNAQMDMLQSTEHSHPYYWAPFILVGDWQ